MRFRLPLLAVSLLAAGCLHFRPAAQSALEGPISGLDTLPRTAPHHVLVTRKGGVEAHVLWAGLLGLGEPVPIRVHTWPGATGYRLSGYANGPIQNVVLQTPQGGELYNIGQWDQPAIPASVLQTRQVRDIFTIRPFRAEDASWRGLAVQEEGDALKTGMANAWRLFSTEDGEHWGPMKLDGAPAQIIGIARFGEGQFALRGEDGWHFFRRASHGWEAFGVPGIDKPARDVDAYDGGHILAVSPAGEGVPKVWFVWTEQGWAPIAQVIPGAPAAPVAIRSVIENRVLSLRSGPGDEPYQDLYFVRIEAGWKRLQDVIPSAPKRIGLSRAFAGDRGLALVSSPTGDAPEPVMSAFWFEKGHWAPFTANVPGLNGTAWDIDPIDGGHAFAVRTGREPGTGLGKFRWQWVVEQQGKWLPLEKALPTDAGAFQKATVDTTAMGVSITVEHDEATQPAAEERVFLLDGDHYAPLAQAVPLPWKQPSLVVGGETETLVRVSDGDQTHFLLRESGHWVDLGEQLAK